MALERRRVPRRSPAEFGPCRSEQGRRLCFLRDGRAEDQHLLLRRNHGTQLADRYVQVVRRIPGEGGFRFRRRGRHGHDHLYGGQQARPL